LREDEMDAGIIGGKGNIYDPKFLVFKEIMTGKDYEKSNYERRYKAVQNET
jgi:hypothetical protein